MQAWTFIALAFSCALGLVLADPRDENKSDAIDLLVKQLTDDDFTRRDLAGKILAAIGEPAVPALKKAAAGSDTEVRDRAVQILRAIVESGTTPRDGEVFLFINANSRRCLTVKDGLIVQGPLAGVADTSSQWQVVRVGDYCKLVHQESGKVLDLPGNAQRPGGQLILSDNSDIPDQLWSFARDGDGFCIKSRVSGFVAAVDSSAIEENAVVIQARATLKPSQSWRLQWVPGARKK
jgi:hypothetical protein